MASTINVDAGKSVVEISETLEAYVPDTGVFSPEEIAEQIITDLNKNDGARIQEWGVAILSRYMQDKLREILRTRRQNVMKESNVFAAPNGELIVDKAVFTVSYSVNAKNQWKHLGEMTGADHQYVADHYERIGRKELLLAEFHRQVAKSVGRKKTSDVLTEQEYLRLYRSIVKN